MTSGTHYVPQTHVSAHTLSLRVTQPVGDKTICAEMLSMNLTEAGRRRFPYV